MKVKDIEVGGEYAKQRAAAWRSLEKVTVVEKNLERVGGSNWSGYRYAEAKPGRTGQYVKVEIERYNRGNQAMEPRYDYLMANQIDRPWADAVAAEEAKKTASDDRRARIDAANQALKTRIERALSNATEYTGHATSPASSMTGSNSGNQWIVSDQVTVPISLIEALVARAEKAAIYEAEVEDHAERRS